METFYDIVERDPDAKQLHLLHLRGHGVAYSRSSNSISCPAFSVARNITYKNTDTRICGRCIAYSVGVRTGSLARLHGEGGLQGWSRFADS